MRYEILNGAEVANVIEADTGFMEANFPDGNYREVFTPEPPRAVPQTVTAFQAQGALLDAGLLDDVEALMAAPDTPRIMKLAWSKAQTFERQSPTVLAMGVALGLDSAALDALFVHAEGITA